MGDKELTVYTAEEVATHNSSASAYIILEGKVYDVTEFLAEHPGGENVLLQMAGQDATSSFQDVGHSKDARAMAEDYMIGRLNISQGKAAHSCQAATAECAVTWKEIIFSPTWSNFLIPLAISLTVYGTYTGTKALFSYWF